MVVRKSDKCHKIHLKEIASILCSTLEIFVSAYLLSELAKNKIFIIITDEKHNPIGQYLPLYGCHNLYKRNKEQLSWGHSIKKQLWTKIVSDKINNQMLNLKYAEVDSWRLLRQYKNELKSGDSSNREAMAAKVYFASFFGNDFNRELDNEINANLNYAYSVLLSFVNRELTAKGVMTSLGIFHKSEFNLFNLSCDLMEPFRPIVDKFVIENNPTIFDSNKKKVLANIPNIKLYSKGGRYKFTSLISMYINDCLRALNKEIKFSEIISFSAYEE